MPGSPDGTLYTFGGDEWIVVQLDEAMSVEVNVRAQAITRRLAELDIDGVVDICPANAPTRSASTPTCVHPRELLARLRGSRPRSATRPTSTSRRGSSTSPCTSRTSGRTRR